MWQQLKALTKTSLPYNHLLYDVGLTKMGQDSKLQVHLNQTIEGLSTQNITTRA